MNEFIYSVGLIVVSAVILIALIFVCAKFGEASEQRRYERDRKAMEAESERARQVERERKAELARHIEYERAVQEARAFAKENPLGGPTIDKLQARIARADTLLARPDLSPQDRLTVSKLKLLDALRLQIRQRILHANAKPR
jgi:hypothetical protein